MGCLIAGTLLAPGVASGHALLTAPRPRDQSDAHKDPNGPCGVTRTAAQPSTMPPLTAGAPLMVTWNETVNHPGCFVVDFSASGDTGWVTLSTTAHKTGTLPRPYMAMVTLPAAPCTACTLRLRQIMLNAEPAAGAACPPANLASGATYYSCANVVLTGGGAADGGVTDAGGGTGGRA
ncbi:MAG: SCE4755 family polysaccharide monooxygenase-like protein, partial [Verrucomicrobiota bacterium]